MYSLGGGICLVASCLVLILFLIIFLKITPAQIISYAPVLEGKIDIVIIEYAISLILQLRTMLSAYS